MIYPQYWNAPYAATSAEVVRDSSIAVMVLTNPEFTDAEFLPLSPRPADESKLAELRASWPGRGLRPLGVIGLCLRGGVSVRCALRAPLDSEQTDILGQAFTAYVSTLLADGMAQEEVLLLHRLAEMPDTRD